jgi:hypothetical protein
MKETVSRIPTDKEQRARIKPIYKIGTCRSSTRTKNPK